MNYTPVGFREFEDGYIQVLDLSDGSYRSECIKTLIKFKKMLSSKLFSEKKYLLFPKELASDCCEMESIFMKTYLNFRMKYKENFGIDPEVYLEYFKEEMNEDDN